MKKRSIYVNRSQELLSLFEQAGSGSKLMCVPIDYAKKDHVVMFCNGYGDILRKPFPPLLSPKFIPKSLVDLYYDDYITFFRTNLKAKKIRERCIIAYSVVKNFYDLIPFIEKLYKQSLWSKYDAKTFPTEYMDYIKIIARNIFYK